MSNNGLRPLEAIYETTSYSYPLIRSYEPGSASMVELCGKSVSYTHLTLPTICSV